MLFIIGRHTRGPLHQGQFPGICFFGHVDAPLDVANGVEILGEFGAVARTDFRRETGHLPRYDVENAAVLLHAAAVLCRVGAVTLPEQALEHPARIVFHRERRCGAAPRHRIEIGVAVGAVAAAAGLAGLQGEFERSQLGVFAQFLRGDLVHRDSRLPVRLRINARQEDAAGGGMRSRVHSNRRPQQLLIRLAGELAQHQQAVLKRSQRFQS